MPNRDMRYVLTPSRVRLDGVMSSRYINHAFCYVSIASPGAGVDLGRPQLSSYSYALT